MSTLEKPDVVSKEKKSLLKKLRSCNSFNYMDHNIISISWDKYVVNCNSIDDP